MSRKLKLKDSIIEALEEGEIMTRYVQGKGLIKLDVNLYDPTIDYDELQKQGWRLFVCRDCEKEFCDGSCDPIIKKVENIEIDNYDNKIEEYNLLQNELQSELQNNIENIETKDTAKNNLEDLSLSELRLLYPDITARSKNNFINKINESN